MEVDFSYVIKQFVEETLLSFATTLDLMKLGVPTAPNKMTVGTISTKWNPIHPSKSGGNAMVINLGLLTNYRSRGWNN